MRFDATTARYPRGLYVLFFTEMWERFSYYGMRALLILYLVNALDVPRAQALEIYATYTALVYLTPLLGGYLADRWLGPRCAVLIGALVMALGHFAMAFPALLYPAMGLLVAGNGFFKPNISTMVGSLYGDDDPRRDSGFTIFYMGINLGAFLAPLVCGGLGEGLGWHYGFAAAGVGMLLGLTVFLVGQRRLLGARSIVSARLSTGEWRRVAVVTLTTVATVGLVVQLWPWVSPWWQLLSPAVRPMLVAGLCALVFVASGVRRTHLRRRNAAGGGHRAGPEPLTRAERERLLAILVMMMFVVFFWMGFEQAGGTMNLFADQKTDRWVAGWEIPASFFQAVNPLLILVLAPPLSLLWATMDRSRWALSAVAKQGLGMIILGSGFIVLAIADQYAIDDRVSPMWLLAVYLLHTTGELFLSPIGLSMVTKLAPVRMVSLAMGCWFTTMAIANYLAGSLENLLHGSGIPLYWFLVGSSIGAGVLLLLVSPWINRLMHGVR